MTNTTSSLYWISTPGKYLTRMRAVACPNCSRSASVSLQCSPRRAATTSKGIARKPDSNGASSDASVSRLAAASSSAACSSAARAAFEGAPRPLFGGPFGTGSGVGGARRVSSACRTASPEDPLPS